MTDTEAAPTRKATRQFTVGRWMVAIAVLAVFLEAGRYSWRNAGVDQAMIQAALRALNRGDAQARFRAAEGLDQANTTDHAPIIAALAAASLGDTDLEVRRPAVRSLGLVLAASVDAKRVALARALAMPTQAPRLGESAAEASGVRAMIRAMGDLRPEVRHAALEAFRRLQHRAPPVDPLALEASPALDRLLDEPDPAVRASAVGCLARMNAPGLPGLSLTLSLLEREPDSGVRSTAIEALAKHWPSVESYAILLARRGQAPTPEERSWVVWSLGNHPPPPVEVLPALIDLMDTDPSTQIAPRLAEDLRVAARPHLPALRVLADREAQSNDPWLWLRVVEAMAKVAPDSPEAQAMLKPMAQKLLDPKVDEYWPGIEGVLRLYGPSVGPLVPTWRLALKSPNLTDRDRAAYLLGQLGPLALEAIDDLEALNQAFPQSPAAEALRKVKRVGSFPR